MKQHYFVVVLAHSLHGRLRRIHIPHQALYVVLGLSSIPMVLELPVVFGWPTTMLVIASAAIYIAGAAVYARRWPNPDPKVFGYHEIFHLMVLLAAGLHFGIITSNHWAG